MRTIIYYGHTRQIMTWLAANQVDILSKKIFYQYTQITSMTVIRYDYIHALRLIKKTRKSFLMLRSHLERGPAEFCRNENLSEFKELAWICESSLWQSHSNRAPSVHRQDRSRPKSQRLPICRISGLPRAVNAISSAGHLQGEVDPGWMYIPWESSYFWAGFGPGAREVLNCCKSSQLFNSSWKCDEEWAIPKFWQRSYRFPHEFTDSSPDLPVFFFFFSSRRDIFTYSF